jgi:hypothetical protein
MPAGCDPQRKIDQAGSPAQRGISDPTWLRTKNLILRFIWNLCFVIWDLYGLFKEWDKPQKSNRVL